MYDATTTGIAADYGVGANEYGRMAFRHWATWRPRALARLEHPHAYFVDLGARVEREIELRAAERLENARLSNHPVRRFIQRTDLVTQVRDEVVEELVLLPPDRALRRQFGNRRRRARRAGGGGEAREVEVGLRLVESA